jgi:endonuclease/exonuclease/phosphatase family metal-dependent hydrolase
MIGERALRKGMERIRKLLERLQPNVVCLQEVDEGSHWNRYINLLEPLRDERLKFAFLGVHNRRQGRRSLAYGNAVLSSLPMLSAEVVAFGSRSIGEKGFIYAELESSGGAIPLVNVHLDYASRRARLAQIEQLVAFIEGMEAGDSGCVAPIICGDFNSTDGRKGDAVEVLLERLNRHHCYTLQPQSGQTFPSLFPMRRLDFVMLPQQWRCRSCSIIPALVSDHLPVFVEVERVR